MSWLTGVSRWKYSRVRERLLSTAKGKRVSCRVKSAESFIYLFSSYVHRYSNDMEELTPEPICGSEPEDIHLSEEMMFRVTDARAHSTSR